MKESQTLTYKWLAGILGMILLSAAGAFGGWMTSAIKENSTDIVALKLSDAHFEADIQVIDHKLDFVIEMFGGEYKGPLMHKRNEAKQ